MHKRPAAQHVLLRHERARRIEEAGPSGDTQQPAPGAQQPLRCPSCPGRLPTNSAPLALTPQF
jgi:hypothetical protein